MDLRNAFTASLCCGTALLLGCAAEPGAEVTPSAEVAPKAEVAPDKPADIRPAPLETYRAATGFDPSRRIFLNSTGFFQMQPVAVTRVHDGYLEEFLRQPGAGLARMVVPPEGPITHWVELVPDSEGDRQPQAGRTGKGPVAYDPVTETIVRPDGTPLPVRERIWLVRERQLVSTDAESGLAVYTQAPKGLHDAMKAKKEGATAPERPLDGFELEALGGLRAGEEVALRESGSDLRMLGAIRARQDCLICHKVEVGTLLGAFSYALRLQSEGTPEGDRLKDTVGLTEREVVALRIIGSRGGRAIRAPGGPVTELRLTDARNRERDAKVKAALGEAATRIRLRDSGLSVVGAFPGLRVLDISHSLVTDAGLKALAESERLEVLDVTDTAVSEAGIAAFRAARPSCEVIGGIVGP